MIKLSERVQRLVPSATLAMAAKAAALRAQGVDVISFSMGEPDFDTPAHIKDAAKASLDRGFTKYTPIAGIPKLRAAIVRTLKEDRGLEYAADEVTVTCGGKQAIANALLTLVGPGDEVIIPAPYWVSFPAQVELADGVPVIIDTAATGLKLTPEALARAVTQKTRVLILNSPSNPSGIVYTAQEVHALAQVCLDHRIAVISDEIYEHLLFDGMRHVSIVQAEPRMRPFTVIANGMSKSFAMTGWRLGWAVGPREVIAKMNELAGQQTTHATSFVQEAGIAALEGSRDDLAKMVAAFEQRRNRMHEQLVAIPGVACHMPQGAFYHFPDMRGVIGKQFRGVTIENDADLVRILLEEAHVATVDGTSFGAPGFIRLSYATSLEAIDEGMERIRRVLTECA